MPLAFPVLLAALDVALLTMILTAEGFRLATKKPHFQRLLSSWGWACGLLLAIAALHLVVLTLLSPATRESSTIRAVWMTFARAPYGYIVTGCVAVGLITAGAYAARLVRQPDDYDARSGLRIGALLALLGLVAGPLAFGTSWSLVAASLLIAAAAAGGISWLWRRYAREPAWLLRAFTVASPLGLLALGGVALVSAPTPLLAREHRAALGILDVLLTALAAVLVVRFALRNGDTVDLRERVSITPTARIRARCASPAPREEPESTYENYHLQDDSTGPSDTSEREARRARAKHWEEPCLGETPEESAAPEVGQPFHEAAGLPAILNTTKFGLREMGPARSLRTFLAVNKVDGFDCQSCAWPSPDKRKVAEFCENGAKAIADELIHLRVEPSFFAEHSIEALLAHSDYWLNAQGRLTQPMIRQEGATHFEPIAWDEAFRLLGSELRSLQDPDEAVFYTAGKTCNEAAFLFQLFARQLGTNNLPDCSNMCQESSGTALTETLGVGKGTVTLDDFLLADTIVIIGNNPGTNHPRMLTTLEAAKHNGATIVSINPMPEPGLMRVINPNPQDYSNPLKLVPALLGPGTPLTDLYVPVRVNGDAALLQGVMKSLLDRERAAPGTVLNRAFIDASTSGFDELAAGIERTSWEEIEESCGLDRAMIERTADVIAHAKRMICVWCTGLVQHPNGVENVQQVVNLLLLGGHMARPGAGTCCVRGHSNVQGDRTMGIWERPHESFLAALDREFGIRAPRRHGYDAVETLHAFHRRSAKVFFAISGNLLQAAADTQYSATALSRARLAVHVSTKLNRGHLVAGERALILPCLGRAERDVRAGKRQLATAEDTMGIVNPSSGAETPASEHLLSDVEIIVRTALATFGKDGPIDWRSFLDNDHIRDRIERTIPGFKDFNARIRKGFFYLPNPAREGVFHTATGKAKFTVCSVPRHGLGPTELLMTTVRSHDQFNTTIYGLDDRYRGIYNGRRVIFLNPEDMRELGLMPGQWVDITSHFEGEKRIARRFKTVSHPIARKSAATYFPEANVLVPVRSVATGSNQPAHKCIRITLAPSDLSGSDELPDDAAQ